MTLFQQLKNYQWPQLWRTVKDKTDIQSIALQAMLISAWWGETKMALNLLGQLPGVNSKVNADPLTQFAVSMSWLCAGDFKNHTRSFKLMPKDSSKWMKQWLKVEFYGRTKHFSKQIELAKKITAAQIFPPNWLMIALLQTLDYTDFDKTGLERLKQWIQPYLDKRHKSQNLTTTALLDSFNLRMNSDLEINTIPVHPVSLYQSAIKLYHQNKIVQALQAFDELAKTQFIDHVQIERWLSLAGSIPQTQNSLLNRINFAYSLVPDSLYFKGSIASYYLIYFWRIGNYQKINQLFLAHKEFLELEKTKLFHNSQVFFRYIINLSQIRQEHPSLYEISNKDKAKSLIVLGESHSLSSANLFFNWQGQLHKGINLFLMGAKMYHLANPETSYHANCAIEYINSFKYTQNHALFCIGEIDCRPKEGIWNAVHKKHLDINEVIENTVSGYINFLSYQLKGNNLKSITIQGIPAPGYEMEDDEQNPGDVDGFLNMIKMVNDRLKELTLLQGWNFLDVYAATVGKDGKGNGKWHIDGYHLSPLFYTREPGREGK